MLDEVKRQLRIDHTEDDADIRELISAARKECEEIKLGKCLLSQTCVDKFDEFGDAMELRWAPVASDGITSIAYLDADGNSQTLSSTVYEIKTVHGMAVVQLAEGQSWPTTYGHDRDITITYSAGYGSTSDDVPVNIRLWIRARAAWIFYGGAIPWVDRMDNLLAPYATGRIIGGS